MNAFKKTIKSKMVFSLLLNALIMLFFTLVFTINYEIADDAAFAQMITDGYTNIFFMNSVITNFIGFVQNILYPLNAYTIIDLLFAYLSMCTITKVFLEKFDVKKTLIMMLFVNAFFASSCYLCISFTRLPGILCAAGFLSIIHYSQKEKWLFGILWGIVLVIIGSLYRFKVFELVFLIAVMLVGLISLSDFINLEKAEKKISSFLKIVFEPKRLISAILIFVAAFSLNTYSRAENTSTDELAHYAEYNSVRSSVWDYDIPSYEEAKQEYEALGIDENDLKFLSVGFIDEDGAFSLDTLYAIRDIKDAYNSHEVTLKSTFINMIKTEFDNLLHVRMDALTVFAFLLVFILFFVLNKKNNMFIPLTFLLALIVVFFYLYYTGRVVFRALFPMIFSLTVYLLYLFDFDRLSSIKTRLNKTKIIALISVFVLLLGAGTFCTVVRDLNLDYYPVYEDANEINEYINDNKDKKFEMSRFTGFTCGMPNINKDVFHITKTDYNANYICFNCTYYLSPSVNYQTKMFGTDNYFSNLLKDDVYFVIHKESDMSKYMIKYLQKYYSNGKTVSQELVKELDNYKIFKYSLV